MKISNSLDADMIYTIVSNRDKVSSEIMQTLFCAQNKSN
jgi:hypothetical protein